MEANIHDDPILVAGKRILIAQATLGLVFIAYEYMRSGSLSAESAITGGLSRFFHLCSAWYSRPLNLG